MIYLKSWESKCVALLGYIAAIVTVGKMGTAVQKCSDTQKRCLQQLGCSMAINQYLVHCSPLIRNETNQCTYLCKLSLLALLTTESHAEQNINSCDCQGNQFCVLQRSRLQVCQSDVMSLINHVTDDTTPLNCSLAVMICTADTSCFTALKYYNMHCRKLVRGEKCTSKCNNSLSILYRQPHALKLRNCICDGSEKYDCPAVHHNTETLCFGDKKQRQGDRYKICTHPIRHHHHNHTRCHHHNQQSHNNDDNNNNNNYDDDGNADADYGENSGDNTVVAGDNPKGKSAQTANGVESDMTGGAQSSNQNILSHVYALVTHCLLTVVVISKVCL